MRTKRSKATENQNVFMIGVEEYERDQAAALDEPYDELTEFIGTTRAAVLQALDSTVEGAGWMKSDLDKLFKVVDKIARRNFTRRK